MYYEMSDSQAGSESARLIEAGYSAWLQRRLHETAVDAFVASNTVDELRSARLLMSFVDVVAEVIENAAKSEVKNAQK